MKEIQNIAIAIIKNSNNQIIVKDDQIGHICHYIHANKMSFLELAKRDNVSWIVELLNTKGFKDKIEEEQSLFYSWEADFLKIKKQWEDAGIDYMFHKSVGSFPYLSDNLDVMVRTKDFVKSGNILREMGYVNLRNIQEEHKEFYRKFIGNFVVGPIHLHERVCWVVPFEDVEQLWKDKLQDTANPLVYYPNFEDGILINTAHCILEDHVVKLKDIVYIKKCIDSKDIDWDYIVRTSQKLHWELSLHTGFIIFHYLYKELFSEEMFPDHIIEQANKFIDDYPWVRKTVDQMLNREVKMPFKVPHLWVRRHTALRELNDPSFGSKTARYYQIIGGLVDRFIHLKLKWHNQPGMFIAISGLDGAGKTRHIEAIENAFLHCDIKTKTIWARAGSLPLTKLFTVLVKGKSTKVSLVNNPKTTAKKTTNSTKISIWRFLNVIDLIFLYSFNVRYNRLRNRAVICDRYYFDMIIDMEAYGKQGKVNRGIYKFLKFIIPTPEMYFNISLSPELIKHRATEEIIEDIDYNYQLLSELLVDDKIINIDNSKEFDDVSAGLTHKILTQYFDKYPEKFKNYKVVSYKYK